MKSGKSSGSDGMISKMFSACPILFAPILKILFNRIFSSGIYPDFWTECLVIAVPESGDLTDPNNYRPIVLVSVLVGTIHHYFDKSVIVVVRRIR